MEKLRFLVWPTINTSCGIWFSTSDRPLSWLERWGGVWVQGRFVLRTKLSNIFNISPNLFGKIMSLHSTANLKATGVFKHHGMPRFCLGLSCVCWSRWGGGALPVASYYTDTAQNFNVQNAELLVSIGEETLILAALLGQTLSQGLS